MSKSINILRTALVTFGVRAPPYPKGTQKHGSVRQAAVNQKVTQARELCSLALLPPCLVFKPGEQLLCFKGRSSLICDMSGSVSGRA